MTAMNDSIILLAPFAGGPIDATRVARAFGLN